MTPVEVADYVGCSPTLIRWAIQRNKLKAKRVKRSGGYEYNIARKEAAKFKRTKPDPENGGWKRGVKRGF